jgi:hypothetical protein
VSVPALTFHGRLPGVDCQPALPAGPTRVRLDVAGFVGFAERGPLDVPVAVEDINQYRAVFGGDVVIATDGGTPLYAHLCGAVQAFFDNGGRRCVVVRVAGPLARPSRWQVPGMRVWLPDGTVEPVHLRAAWPGSWSTAYGVGTQLLRQALAVTAPYLRPAHRPKVLSLDGPSLLPLRPGDLLRLDLGPALPGLYVTVAAVDRARSTVAIGAEVPYADDLGSPPGGGPVPLRPDALAALPDTVPVRAAWRLRMDLVAREVVAGASQLLERWTDLGFAPAVEGSWLDVVQPVDDDTPDLRRSTLLRADPDTVAMAAAGGLFVPVGMDEVGTVAEFVDPAGEPLVTGDDGLSGYAPADLFLDPELRQDTVYSLLADADQLTVLAPRPRALHGIHALLGVDEVALVSVPDAVHVGWSSPVPAPPPVPPPPPPPPPAPDWSAFRDCAVPASAPPSPPPVPPVPEVPRYPVADDPAGYDPGGLLEVHTALVRMCAARNDMIAVLGVPRHFDTAAVLAFLQRLTENARPSQAGRIVMSPLSFAGFWYPWVRVPEPTTPALAPLRDQPADGAVCGMIAARELARGAWVAPAGVPMRGLVGLARTVPAEDTYRLFDAHTNLLTALPGTISTSSAHTLAAEPALQQVSVRRLLILLRKVALIEGNRYVFDTNTERFRQLVRRRFERLLSTLTRRGALAAYQILADGAVNAAEDPDSGRLVVVLRVAPTIPIEFITVSLVRAGEGLLDVVVG